MGIQNFERDERSFGLGVFSEEKEFSVKKRCRVYLFRAVTA